MGGGDRGGKGGGLRWARTRGTVLGQQAWGKGKDAWGKDSGPWDPSSWSDGKGWAWSDGKGKGKEPWDSGAWDDAAWPR